MTLSMSHLKSAIDNTLWLADPVGLRRAILRVASFRDCPTARHVVKARRAELAEARAIAQHALPSTGIDDPAERQAATGKPLRAVKGKVGVIPIFGPIGQRMSAELEKSGGVSMEAIGAAFDTLLNDASIGAIVLHFDSPGGESYGCEELSDQIHNARGRKPIIAHANSLMASAAYWIGTAADTVVVTPGGDVGSVGVFAAHVDESKAMEQEGIVVTMVKAGKHKAEWTHVAPLSAEARDYLQQRVDETYGKFVEGLRRNRGVAASVVRERFGQGRVVGAEAAVAAGMADRVATFAELIGKLTGAHAAGNGGAKAVSTEVLKLRHEQRKRQAAHGWAG